MHYCLIFHLQLLPSNPSSRSRSSTTSRDPVVTRVSTVMKSLWRHAAVDTRSPLTLRSLGGTGLSRPNATEQTTAQGSVSSCTCSSTHMHTWWTRLTHGVQLGPAAHPPRCHPLTCSISTARSRSSMERSTPWWLTTVAALEDITHPWGWNV